MLVPNVERIGGLPLGFERVSVGSQTFEMAVIEDLEAHLDRDRLLADSSYEPPYWALVWSGARLFLPSFLSRHAVAGKTVLDVGCGLGLVSLVLAGAGAQVTALDRAGVALEFLRRSAECNGLSIERCALDLEDLDRSRTFDYVIAAELLYERDSFGRLATGLLERLKRGGCLTVVDAHRVNTQPFYGHLQAAGGQRVFGEQLQVREEKTLVRIDVGDFECLGPDR